MAKDYWVFHRVLLDQETQASDAATKVVELPKSNDLHALFVKVECTNGATSAKSQDITDVADLITVYGSASDVVASLTPMEAKRWYQWKTGLNIPQHRSELAGDVQWAVFPFFFGRYAFDPDYWLPMAKMEDPRLHIAYSPTIAATAFVTGTTKISVWALMSMGRDPGQYKGSLSCRTIKSFTSAAAGDDETLITRGNLLRQILVNAYEAGTDPFANITRIKFSLNDDERVMYDAKFEHIQQWNALDSWPGYYESIVGLTQDADVESVKGANIEAVTIGEGFTNDVAGDTEYSRRVTAIAGDALTIHGYAGDWTGAAFDETADATDRRTYLSVRHNALPSSAVLDFTKAGEGNLLNTRDWDKISLKLTQGNAGAAVRVSTEEVRQF